MEHHDVEIAGLFQSYDPTNTGSLDHPRQFDRCHPDDQDALLTWVRDHVTPSSRGYRSFQGTSYGLKHLAEEHLGHSVSNGDMKGAMLAAGYDPVNPRERNWRWRIRLVSSVAENGGTDSRDKRGAAAF